jgi:hypothetical protein
MRSSELYRAEWEGLVDGVDRAICGSGIHRQLSYHAGPDPSRDRETESSCIYSARSAAAPGAVRLLASMVHSIYEHNGYLYILILPKWTEKKSRGEGGIL